MYELYIEGERYTRNEDWSVKEWQALKRYDPENKGQWAQIIATAFSAPLHQAAKIPLESQEVGVGLIALSLELDPKPSKLELINLKEMTMGQWADLEVLVSRGLYKNLHLIVNILFNISNGQDQNIKEIWDGVTKYLDWRIAMLRNYKGLFGFDPDEVEVEEGETKQSTEHIWYDMIMVLADGKFLNIDRVTERPVIEAFNWLAWKKDQDAKAELELQKHKRKHDVQRSRR